MLAVGLDRIMRFHEGDHVLEQVGLEVLAPAGSADFGRIAAAAAAPAASAGRTAAIVAARAGLRDISIGKDDNHRLDLLFGEKVIENDVRRSLSRVPLGFLIAT